jgi:hypothetical protein
MDNRTDLEVAMDSVALRVEEKNLNAYYYSFTPTGDDDVDLILAAVAYVGNISHHTEKWSDNILGVSCVDVIQEAANRMAINRKEHTND